MRPTRRSDMVLKEIGGETLLYSAEQKKVHVLNSTARLIWDLCDGTHDLSAMTQILRAHFSVVSGYDLSKVIRCTLDVFAEKGLLQPEAEHEAS